MRVIKKILIACFCAIVMYSTTAFASSYSVASEYDFLDASIKNNCVAFARYKVPSLPGGLDTLEDKKKIINSYSPMVGAIAITSGNSILGHVAYVEAVNGSQIVTLNGGFMDNSGYTGHIERISGTESEQGIVGYWCPGNISWYAGMTPVNEGSDFYTPIIKAEGWIGITDNNGNAELTDIYDGREMWHFIRQSDGSYVIYNCKSNRVLCTVPTPKNVPKNNNVATEVYNGMDNQKWFIYGRWSGEYYLKPKTSDKVLDVTGGSNAVGTNVQLYEYNGTGGQKIAFYKQEPAGGSILSKTEGDSVHKTTFRWTKASNATMYNLRIRKSVSGEMQDYKIIWSLTDTSYDIILPDGYYEVYVDSCNTFSFKTSNIVSFAIQKGQHSYIKEITPASCTKAGRSVYTCEVCGDTYTEEIPATGHKWDKGVITKEATATSNGLKTYTCETCGTLRTEEISASSSGNPAQPEMNPTQPETNPTQPETNPSQPETNPTQPETNPSQSETNPTQRETNSTQPETNLMQPETNPTQSETNLKQTETNPSQPVENQSHQNTTAQDTQSSESARIKQVPIGTKLKNVSGGNYHVTGAGCVEFTKPVGKKNSIHIPSQILVNGITYQVTSIAANAFRNNKKIKSVTIGAKIQKIGANAFYGCKNLKNIYVETKKLKKNHVGKNAFSGINKKAVFRICADSKVMSYKKIMKAKGAPATAKYKFWIQF